MQVIYMFHPARASRKSEILCPGSQGASRSLKESQGASWPLQSAAWCLASCKRHLPLPVTSVCPAALAQQELEIPFPRHAAFHI